ncbi:MAG: DegT/DnrJ/EryC1/StrS family aminotransferase [Verrucomicrobiota bacterium]|nr:DegT/DnrJ/EryC1/StrS family aminotransferase [Verrucomicrobiota bacterium]
MPPLEEYQNLLRGIWERGHLTNRGPLACELEMKLCRYLGLHHLLFVCNGTIALQIAIKALDLKGEIITTPFSYVATTSSIVWEGCTPVFVDIDPETLCIDPGKIETAITEKTSAILATHVYGIPCDVERIEVIARKHGLKVIYDAAHCFGVKYKGQNLLNYGDISTISFHATKLFHTGEGGGIIAKEPAIQAKIFSMHNFGHNGPEEFIDVGVNGKASEFHAALGLAVLPYIDEILQARRRLSELYKKHLNLDRLKLPLIPIGTEYNYAYFPVIFPSEKSMLAARDALNRNGINPRRYFYPSLNTLCYLGKSTMKISDEIVKKVLCLPLFPELTKTDVLLISHLTNQSLDGVL